MTTKNELERRLSRFEEQADEHIPVAFFDTVEEAKAYNGKASLLIVDDIVRSDA